MRLVINRDTGQKKPKDESYKAENGYYYSSEAAYRQMREKAEQKNRCYDLLMELMGYDKTKGHKLPTLAVKKMEEYRNSYGFDVLYETILSQSDNIRWALSNRLESSTELNKVSYIFAILRNNVMTEYRKKKRQEKQEKESQKKLAEVNESPVEISGNIPRQQRKDLSVVFGGNL